MAKRDYSRQPIPYSPDHVNHLPAGASTISSRRPPRLKVVDRIALSALLVFLLAYFALGIWIDDLPIPRWRWGGVTHLHGPSIWLLLGAFLCYVIYRVWYSSKETLDDALLRAPFFLPSDLVPERGGKPALALACLGWCLFLASLVSMFFVRP